MRRINDIPSRTVPGVRAAPEDLICNRTSTSPEFSAVGILKDRDFADGFVVDRLRCLAGDIRVVVVLPVEKEIVGPWPRSVHREPYTVRQAVSRRHVLHAGLG